jgi:hypothetical protein
LLLFLSVKLGFHIAYQTKELFRMAETISMNNLVSEREMLAEQLPINERKIQLVDLFKIIEQKCPQIKDCRGRVDELELAILSLANLQLQDNDELEASGELAELQRDIAAYEKLKGDFKSSHESLKEAEALCKAKWGMAKFGFGNELFDRELEKILPIFIGRERQMRTPSNKKESMKFIKSCIEDGSVLHFPVVEAILSEPKCARKINDTSESRWMNWFTNLYYFQPQMVSHFRSCKEFTTILWLRLMDKRIPRCCTMGTIFHTQLVAVRVNG